MSKIASIATANDRIWSFGKRYRKRRVWPLACVVAALASL